MKTSPPPASVAPSSPAPRLIAGLSTIAAAYDLFLVDQWGVLHDGVTLFPEAVTALQRLRETGKRVILLSNSGRRAQDSASRLGRMGLSPELYDHMITSGEMLWRGVRLGTDPFYRALGRRFLPFSWEQEHRLLLEGADKEAVDRVADANFLLCAGADQGDLAYYQPILEQALARDLPMLCANPDRVSLRPDGVLVMCAGAIAAHYEEMGGRVRWHGKPLPETYAQCRSLEPDCVRPLGIGDSLDHDIRGARDAGAGSLLICDGIHRDDLGQPPETAALARLCASRHVAPDFATERLRW